MSNNLNIKMLWLTMSLLILKTHLWCAADEEEKEMNNKFPPLIYRFGLLSSPRKLNGFSLSSPFGGHKKRD